MPKTMSLRFSSKRRGTINMIRNIGYPIVFVKLNSFSINAVMCDPVHGAETTWIIICQQHLEPFSEICSLQGITHI